MSAPLLSEKIDGVRMSLDTQRAGELFEQAVQLGSDERTQFLNKECGGQDELRQRIEEMLAAAEGTTPLETISPDLRAYMVARMQQLGERVGRYKLLQKIGEGGCGVVYMAEQEEPVRRRVALKVIKRGMDSRQVIARFEAERQALAMMDHPNIARVLDAGETDGGQPFFVMELVKGLPITDYCDREKLSPDERLKLFIQVCHAIQHAHQKGIIHRDIKPSNVLVAFQDGTPVPKVIDFGIAKAVEVKLTEKTLFTALEQFVGTPAYMSPEQAEMSSIDIDTRSDIYSLGVLLYELLTGTTPFDTHELLAAGIHEIRRKIREDEPPKPSARLSTLQNADLAAAAVRRATDAPKLISALRGDLDWIVMKALDKQRGRRYETANGLAQDVRRYLNNEPVTARPPSALYQFQKLAHRHKTMFAAVSAVALSIIGGLGLSLFLYGKERVARSEALAARQNAEKESARNFRMSERLALEMAESRFASHDPQSALAYLAMVVRKNPTNQPAVLRLISALTDRSHMLPLWTASDGGLEIADRKFDLTGRLLLSLTTNGMVHVRDAATGKLVRRFQATPGASELICGPRDRVICLRGQVGAQVWDYSNGEPLTQFLESTNIYSASFNPTGDLFYGRGFGNLSLWRLEGGKALEVPLSRTNDMFAAFNERGEFLTCCDGGALRRWNTQTGAEVGKPVQLGSEFWEISEDGRYVYDDVLGPEGNRYEIRDSETGRLVYGPFQTKAMTVPTSFSEGGEKVAISHENRARVVNLRTGVAETVQPEADFLTATRFTWDANAVFGGTGRWIEFWDLKTSERLLEKRDLETDSLKVAFISPDGQWAVTFSADRKSMWLWDCRFGKALSTSLPHEDYIRQMRLSPDQTKILSIAGDHARISTFPEGNPIRDFVFRGVRPHIGFLPDGNEFVGAYGGTAWRFDINTGQVRRAPLEGDPLFAKAELTADGRRLATLASTNVTVWDFPAGKILWSTTDLPPLWNLEISPNGEFLMANAVSSAKIFRLETGALQLDFTKERNLYDCRFTGRGDKLLAVLNDHRARIYDLATGAILAESSVQPGQLTCGVASPDETRIFLASGLIAHLWDAQMKRPLTMPMRHADEVSKAEFSGDGRMVATLSEKAKAIRIWEAETGEPRNETFVFQDIVYSFQFSPDSRWLIVASGNEVHLRQIAQAEEKAPEWLPTLAEAVGGAALREDGSFQRIAPDELLRLKRELSASPSLDHYSRWAKWFFADRAGRAIYPGAAKTVREYVRDRLKVGTEEALADAARVARAEPAVLASLARTILSNAPARTNQALWLSHQAIRLQLRSPLAWLARAEAEDAAGDLEAAFASLESAESHDASSELASEIDRRKGLLLKKAGRPREAIAAFSRAIEKLSLDADGTTRHALFLERASARADLRDRVGAKSDFLLAKEIAPRPNDPRVIEKTVDLTDYYNLGLRDGWNERLGKRLAEDVMSPGLNVLQNLPFDVRGRIQLAGQEMPAAGNSFPTNVSGIRVDRAGLHLHFLHASCGEAEEETRIGTYRVHLADGQTHDIPLQWGITIYDCDGFRLNQLKKNQLNLAWRGERPSNRSFRAYLLTWTNPTPDIPITAVDFISDVTSTAPFLLGITVD